MSTAAFVETLQGRPPANDAPHEQNAPAVNAEQERFLALLRHELQTPLCVIRGAVTLLRQCGTDLAQLEWIAGLLERQTQHLSRLLDDMIDLARVSDGAVRLRKEPVEIAQIVSQAVETARPWIEEHGHRLDVTVPPGLAALEADRTRLLQVLTNLLSNAAKYTPDNGRVSIVAGQQGDHIVLRVRDSGIGITAAQLPHVFEPYWRAEPSVARSREGLGIGLALVRRLVEAHGGSVCAASAGPGNGSEFVVRLPRRTSSEVASRTD